MMCYVMSYEYLIHLSDDHFSQSWHHISFVGLTDIQTSCIHHRWRWGHVVITVVVVVEINAMVVIAVRTVQDSDKANVEIEFETFKHARLEKRFVTCCCCCCCCWCCCWGRGGLVWFRYKSPTCSDWKYTTNQASLHGRWHALYNECTMEGFEKMCDKMRSKMCGKMCEKLWYSSVW